MNEMVADGAVDLLAFLRGRWHFDRVIDDHRAATTVTATGTATMATAGDIGGVHDRGLSWEEQGRLALPHGCVDARRRMHLSPEGPDGAVATVCFEDGRFFHRLALGEEPWRVTHDCAPDRYEGTFVRHSGQRWRSEWVVTGPVKDLRIVTDYRPM